MAFILSVPSCYITRYFLNYYPEEQCVAIDMPNFLDDKEPIITEHKESKTRNQEILYSPFMKTNLKRAEHVIDIPKECQKCEHIENVALKVQRDSGDFYCRGVHF
ncbi:unnamed protein product [Caenorhabditis bovis]|uniref:Uncharacterized protein n=1 Tax=Caenorhabditis bovis TaxID=2654633 RepID=A0A8S1EGV3_9PELO|nr:unnamed protein product [Caenorhabditis bovis]